MILPKWLQLKPHNEVTVVANIPSPSISATPICQHVWQERLRSYAPPRQDIPTNLIQDHRVLEIMAFGVTTVLDECSLCHETKTTMLHGSPDPQLDEMLDKVLLYGPQFMQRDNNTFVFQRYVPQAQPTGLPLR